MNIVKAGVIFALVGGGLAGCAESGAGPGPDFGVAVRQDVAAQIADPEARYGTTPPSSNGVRAANAQARYQNDAAITSDVHASTIGATDASTPPPPVAPAGQ